MTGRDVFEIDGVRFIIDLRVGHQRGKSKNGEFVLVKTPAVIDFYRSLQRREPRTILELGMFEGGSLVLFDKLYRPQHLIGVDLRDEIAPLESYRADKEHITALYRRSQDDPELPRLLSRELPDGIDLIVDDASHHYAQTRAAFHLCFPLLKPGGLYVIEDWAWSHQEPYQAPRHPWHDKPALTNLIMELIINLPGSGQLSTVTVRRDLAVIEKAAGASGAIDLNEGQARLRGRRLEPL